MDFFKKPYTLRSFGKTGYVNGSPEPAYSARTVKLDVQPLSSTEALALPEGIRRDKNIRAIGKTEMKTADDAAGILADRLFYRGQWYECTGADTWGNTPAGQTEAVFGLVPATEGGSPPDMPESVGTGGGNRWQ